MSTQNDKKSSLMNLDGLGEVCNNLINKLSDGVGWVANRETPKKIACDEFIKDIQKSDYDALTKAALISSVKKIINEYTNQNDIYQIAIQNIKSTAKPQVIENDWLNLFMDKARLVSDSEFQVIWGKILAEECNEPNSIPKSLLSILEQMDRKDAIAFSTLCSVSVYVQDDVKDYTPMVIASYLEDFYFKIGLTYNALVDLQALGLIEISMGLVDHAFTTTYEKTPFVIQYYENVYEFPEGMNKFHSGNVMFTKAGQALCRAIEVNKIENFWEKYCIPIWEEDVRVYMEEKREQKDCGAG